MIYLYRINDRSYGFRICGIQAENEEEAKILLKCRYSWINFDDRLKCGFAELIDHGCYIEFEFEE